MNRDEDARDVVRPLEKTVLRVVFPFLSPPHRDRAGRGTARDERERIGRSVGRSVGRSLQVGGGAVRCSIRREWRRGATRTTRSASAEGGGDVIVDAVERAARGDVEGEGEEPKETGTEEKGGDVDGVVGDDVSSAKGGAERGPV
jgi:hypothetical protein